MARSTPTAALPTEGKKLRQLPLPPRLARMVIDAGAEGSALQAAELAALIGERGLGGDDIDLRGRLNALHRDRSNRGRDARAMAQRWAETATPTPSPSPQGGGEMSVGALIALAYPERIAKNRGGGSGAFLLVNGRGANVDAASPLAREPFLVVAELTGTAAQGRILSAAPITLAEIEARFAGQIESRDDINFDAATGSLRGRRSRKLGAVALAEAPIAIEASEQTAKLLAEKITSAGIGRLPWTKAIKQWRDRVMFLRASEGDEWPDLSDTALAASASEWLAPSLADKTSIGKIGADELAAALEALLPWPLKRRLDAEAPTHFEAPTGTQAAIDYEAEGGPEDRHPGAGTVRPRSPSGDCRRQSSAGHRIAVAGASSGADHARSARLLARQLCRGPHRHARTLSEASLARRSDRGAADAAGKTARHLDKFEF